MILPPKVFLSYAFEDTALADKIANTLQENGIDTWWAEWCISAGDSIRQRIDEGLGDCTHFVVLLTPKSIGKSWVNAEIDAGLIRKLGESTRFIPLRCGLPASDLSPLLRGMLSPELDPTNVNLSQLIGDIHGVSRKPPLGPVPKALRAVEAAPTGFSASATAVARLFVQSSKNGKQHDPSYELARLATELQLSEEDTRDAVFELGPLVNNYRDKLITPEDALFVAFDRFWMPWDAETDAFQVAVGLINDPDFPKEQDKLAEHLGWPARRLNPAIAYLADRALILFRKSTSGRAWRFSFIMKTDETRRFVKSRS